jgi:hypothetical protein
MEGSLIVTGFSASSSSLRSTAVRCPDSNCEWRWPSQNRSYRMCPVTSLMHVVRLADLCPYYFAGDDDFHTAIFLPSPVRAVIGHGLGLAQPNGCHRVCA